MAKRTQKRKVGRPTKRSPVVVEAIMHALERGLSLECTARRAGIGPTTLDRWIADDKAFAERVECARAQAIEFAADKLRDLIEGGNLGAICFFLKTRGGPDWREHQDARIRLADAPKVETLEDVGTVLRRIVQAVAAGELGVTEAGKAVDAVNAAREGIESAELDRRLRALEEKVDADRATTPRAR